MIYRLSLVIKFKFFNDVIVKHGLLFMRLISIFIKELFCTANFERYKLYIHILELYFLHLKIHLKFRPNTAWRPILRRKALLFSSPLIRCHRNKHTCNLHTTAAALAILAWDLNLEASAVSRLPV